MSYPPSMVHKSGNRLVVRSVVSGDNLYGTSETDEEMNGDVATISSTRNMGHVDSTSVSCNDTTTLSRTYTTTSVNVDQNEELPQCKVKRNYACSSCSYYTQNPRYYLHHLKNVHKEKIRIYECPHCLYASKHSQKLQRHIHMVHVMGKRKLLIKTKTPTSTTSVATAMTTSSTRKSVPPATVGNGKMEEDLRKSSPSHRDVMNSAEKNQMPTAKIGGKFEDRSKVNDSKAVANAAASEYEETTVEVNESNSQNQSLKCSLCSFSSRNPNLVARHERLVHLKKKFYRCTKCDYITHMKARFTKHVKYHSMPMIKCDMCDFRTPYKWNLDRHNKNHYANGAFKCSQCNFTADIKQSLTVHEMNHHVPPVNQNGSAGLTVSTPAKRRCRVGASDTVGLQQETSLSSVSVVDPDYDDMELLRMERESLSPPITASTVGNANASEETAQMAAVEITMVKSSNSPAGNNACKNLNLKNPTAAAYLNGTLKPEDVILTKNGSVYVKKFKCRVCHYKAAWESEMIRHEVRVHGLDSSPKRKSLPRPIPNLIPIQNNNSNSSTTANISCTSSNSNNVVSSTNNAKLTLSMKKFHESSALRNGFSSSHPFGAGSDYEFEKPMTEKDLNDICAKSCATSSLKDFASLIGAPDEAFKNERLKDFSPTIPPDVDKDLTKARKVITPPGADTKSISKLNSNDNDVSVTSAEHSKKLPDSFKKKNASFFDRLKEKLMVGFGESNNLVCWCGHKSKCLSESVIHQKQHTENMQDKNDKLITNGPLISGAELSSTRCQHCRQRCKTSSDLFVHLQSCSEMIKKGNDANCSNAFHSNGTADVTQTSIKVKQMDEHDEIKTEPEPEEYDEDPVESNEVDKEENKIFVWNRFSDDKDECCDEYGAEDDGRSKSPASESSLVGYEIAPGIGSILPNANEYSADQFKYIPSMNIDINNVETSTKKVFKCPQCTFWASTASRFHVHIVSHLNVKPFGCSVCTYQSKWKWDVTKHIRLKKERDPVHETAEIHTIDMETGRRNYSKYNRFLTSMKVHEPLMENAAAVSTSKPHSPKMSVPSLPKLTPAPSIDSETEKCSPISSSDISMRPLPLLHPANPSIPLKRPHDETCDSDIPKKKLPSEKKMWKCKKCKFRNTDRNVVLAHVREHYTNSAQTSNEQNSLNNNTETYNAYNKEFRQKMENQEMQKNISQSGVDDSNNVLKNSDGNFKCRICSFETESSSTLQIHNRHHIENSQATYKCCFCPFYSNDKLFILNHISIHGVQNVEESLPLLINNRLSSKQNENINGSEGIMDEGDDGCDISDINNEANNGITDEMEIYKRFRCSGCPYVTNNKSQYLYHKQFHRLRGAPFKCNICTYNVTKRHLLHQHLKIHGVQRSQFKNCIYDSLEKESDTNLITNIETTHLPDIPLVWVHKTGTLTKMFKCRHCPHVNLRKSNIHEHEKMHFDRIQRSPNGTISTNQAVVHRCTECNYVCNNAGALASHFKVHQGAFGQICALADPQRSDESQIKEITRLLKEDERFKKDSSSKDNQQTLDCGKNIPKKVIAQIAEVPAGLMNKLSTGAIVENQKNSCDTKPNEEKKLLHFCHVCPARFLCLKDYESHVRFHSGHHPFKCNSCTYSAPQQAQLCAHKRVHTNDYQEKTNMMTVTYEMSKDRPRPKTTLILDKPGFSGLGWVVVHSNTKKIEEGAVNRTKVVTKQFSCHKCPAKFFKSVALQHHLTLHGGKDPYQCRSCDYRVKTYGNLIKHETVHGLEPRNKIKNTKSKKPVNNLGSIPCSGTELFQHRTEQILKERIGCSSNMNTPPPPPPPSLPLQVDPEFGILMHGSPEFIYPTTLKNGKMKDKRYKCHKCPSAFEKREQYKIHLPLHGAKYRYKCEKCDYSVKYYANYAQHMRKHEFNERSLSERRASTISKASEDSNNDVITIDGSIMSSMTNGNSTDDGFYSPEKSPTESIPLKASKTLHISVADQQAVVLMQEKVTDNIVNLADQLHRCYYCPYSHPRKDAVENHERCHFNTKGSYVCEFCNYTVPQPHFLREHQKLHFGSMKGVKPEAFMKCDRLEIWMETEEGKVLIFKDNGSKNHSRFEPAVQMIEEEAEYKKMYVDVKTGEECPPLLKEEESSAEEKPQIDEISESFSPVPSSASCLSTSPARIKEEFAEEERKKLFIDEMKECIDDEFDSKLEEPFVDGIKTDEAIEDDDIDHDEMDILESIDDSMPNELKCEDEPILIDDSGDEQDEVASLTNYESDAECSNYVENEPEPMEKTDELDEMETCKEFREKPVKVIFQNNNFSISENVKDSSDNEQSTRKTVTPTSDHSDSEDSDSSSTSSSCTSSCFSFASSNASSCEGDQKEEETTKKQPVTTSNQD